MGVTFASNGYSPGPTVSQVPVFANTGTLTGQQQQLMSALTQGLTGGGGPLALDPTSTANYIQQSVAAPLLQQYDQSIMPRINDAYASVGALMGSRRGFADQQALNNLQTTIAQQLGQAQLSNQQLRANLSAQLTNQSQMAIQPYLPHSQYAGMGANINLPNGQSGMNGFQLAGGFRGQQTFPGNQFAMQNPQSSFNNPFAMAQNGQSSPNYGQAGSQLTQLLNSYNSSNSDNTDTSGY